MKTFNFLSSFLFCLFLLFSSWSVGQNIQFIENKGQWAEHILYEAPIPDGKIFLEKDKWTFALQETIPHTHEHNASMPHDVHPRKHAYQMEFVGALPHNQTSASNPLETYNNYFIGNDRTQWAKNVPMHQNVQYHNLYEKIDLSVGSENGVFKYDFIVAPNADVAQIQMQFTGLDDLHIKDNHLYLKTSLGEMVKLPPYVYQKIDDKQVEVACTYKLENNVLSYDFPSGYDSRYELVIDPYLIFSTFSGATADNWAFAATYDDEGNAYTGSIVYESGYPTTMGAYNDTFNGGNCDVVISKFSADGSDLIYSTYIGGDRAELPHSILVNSQNELIVFGTTASDNFPTSNDAWDSNFDGGSAISWVASGPAPYLEYANGSDIFLLILNEAGNDLIGSTYFGGGGNDGINFENTPDSSSILNFNYGDHVRGDITIDENDNIYLASCTRSSSINGPSFLYDEPFDNQDGLIAKFNNTLSNLEWYTYLGGNGEDATYSIKLHDNDFLYVCGGTQSTNIFSNLNGFITNYQGGQADGFIISVDKEGQSLVNGTYIGSDQYDQTYFIDFDSEGFVYTFGQSSGDFDIVENVYQDGRGQFIQKLSTDLSTLEWTSTFGQSDSAQVSLVPTAFKIGTNNKIYLAGWGGDVNNAFNSNTGTTTDFPITSDAFQIGTDGSDLYFMTLSANADSLVYATYFGGSGLGGRDHSDGSNSRITDEGVLYQAVCAGCFASSNFPTTQGVWSNTNGSSYCNMAMVKFDLNGDGNNPPIISNLDELELKKPLKVFPNPSSGQFRLVIDEQECVNQQVWVYNVQGKMMANRKMQNNLLDLSDLTKGSYFLLVHCKDKVYRASVVLE